MTLIPSTEAEDFMDFQKDYDKNQGNIINKDDYWYYNDKTHVTNSHLSQLIKGGPQTLKAYYEKGSEDNDAFAFGRAAHCLLLEPDSFNQRFYSIDDTEICIEASGEDWKEKNKSPRATKIYKEWLAEILEENSHRQLLSLDDFTDINNMVDKAMGYTQVRELVESASKREVIYSKTINGIKTKCKVDAINPSNFILDYKTSRDAATLRNFSISAKKYGYPRQGAFYRDITGVTSFWFLVQEKTYPYTVCLAELSPDTYEEGKMQYQNALEQYKLHFINNPKLIDSYLEMGSI